MTWTALPAVAATVTVALVALATLRIEGGSRRGLGMAGFLLVFGAAEFAAALAHLTPADQAPPATAMRWSYILGVMAYLPMIEFLGDLARRSGAERPLGVPLSFSEAFLRMVCVALLLLLAGGDLAYAGVIASPTGHGWVRQWGPLWPALGVVGALYVSWAVACWNGERRRRGHIDADLGAWLAAIMLLTCGPILTSTILPATGLAHTNNLNGLSTVLGGLATVTGLVLSRRLQLERIAPAEELDPTQDDVGDADGDPLAPVVLACTGCKAQYMRLPDDAMCSQDGRPVKTGRDPMVGTVVADKWRILRFLGAGGMARVYAAEHRHLHTRCAIKVIWGDLLGDERAFERFLREAQACRRLESPHIVKLQDVAEVQKGLPLLVLELVEGESFDQYLLGSGPLGAREAALLGSQLAQGLEEAHGAGIVHRDLKPANVMVVRGADRDLAKIVDFGLAKRFDGADETRLTRTGMVTGTPAYLSPEQIMGEPPTPASDYYALGIMLYEALVGRRPFDGATPRDVCRQHLHEPPDGSLMSGPMAEVVMELLDKSPDRREESAPGMVRRLAELADGAKRFGSVEAP